MKPPFIFVLTCISFFIFSCQSEGITPTNCRKGKCIYTIQQSSELEYTVDTLNDYNNIQVISGDKLVFDYEYTKREKKNISDDQYTEHIYFEIEKGKESFRFENSTLNEIQATFIPYCFCPTSAIKIRKGVISGEKVDENFWMIEIDVEFERGNELEERVISANFEIE